MRDRWRVNCAFAARMLLGVLLASSLPMAPALPADPAPKSAAMVSQADQTGGFDPSDLIFLCVPGYFLLQAALTLRTSGGWRKATLVPAVIMAPILAYTVLALAAQSNLWPLLMLLSAPLACFYLITLSLILLLRRLVRAA